MIIRFCGICFNAPCVCAEIASDLLRLNEHCEDSADHEIFQPEYEATRARGLEMKHRGSHAS